MGSCVCNDNTNAALLDPTVTLTKPAQGRYNIWLGSALARDLIPGFLVFTGQGDVSAGGLTLQNLVTRPARPEMLPLSNRLTSAADRLKEAIAAVKSAEKLASGQRATDLPGEGRTATCPRPKWRREAAFAAA